MPSSIIRLLIIIGLSSLVLFACSKEDEEFVVPSIASSKDYFPLEIGNFWVYENYDIDTLGQASKLSMTDSIYISKQIVVNGFKYYVLEGSHYPYTARGETKVLEVIRKTGGDIVDTSGRILFSNNNFSDSLYVNYEIINGTDTFHSDVFKMIKAQSPIQVPVGTFYNVLIYHGLHYMHMTNLPPFVPNPRDYDFYYASGVGLIKNNFFYSLQPGYSEKRLLRYQVN
ncbi:MAG: hypothetical protein RID18_10060 [Cytophagales bacterium]